MLVTANAYGAYSGRYVHNDTTTMNVQGAYAHEEGDLDTVPIQITHGFSKEGLDSSKIRYSSRTVCSWRRKAGSLRW
jgi:hypothetical protein